MCEIYNLSKPYKMPLLMVFIVGSGKDSRNQRMELHLGQGQKPAILVYSLACHVSPNHWGKDMV